MERLQAPSKAETGMMEGMMTVSDFTFLLSVLMRNGLSSAGAVFLSGDAHLNNGLSDGIVIVHML